VTYDQQGQITNSYGDIIIKIDGNDVRKIDDILTYLEREKKVNDTVTLTVIRDNQLTDLSMVLGARPTQQEDLAAGEFGDQSAPELGGEYSECPSYVPQSLCDLFAQ
jgi:predicted metalloprotease with PDZ domain